MNTEKKFYFFTIIVIALVLGFFAYQVIRPFIVPILWAGVISILFYPFYEFFQKRIRWKSFAALITLLIVLLVILGPFSYLSVLVASEIKDVVVSIEKGEPFGIRRLLDMPAVAWTIDKIYSISGVEEFDIEQIVRENLSNFGREMAGRVKAGVKNVATAVFNFIFMALTTFFFLRDGSGVLKRLREYLPFEGEQRNRIEIQVKDMVISTIYGGVVVAVVQGVMGGIAFYFLDVPSPALWGTAISIMSFIPILGTFSIWGSIVVYLIIQDLYTKALILFIIGTFGISLVDNILKPIIIGERTKMPTLLILFSVLGGIKLFGLLGLIMGPMSVALFLSVFDIFRDIEGGAYD